MKNIDYFWNFEAINLSDFNLTLEFDLKGKIAKYARIGIVKAISKKTGTKIDDKIAVWEDLPTQIYSFVNLQCKQFIKTIESKELNPDGVYILHEKVSSGKYRDNGKKIKLKIKITGQYTKK